jgi:branched-chain amino acid transport system substrate-binding protein
MGSKNTSAGFTRRASLGLLAATAATPLLGRGFGSDITIGALLSLTGDWSTLGLTSKALLQIAVNEINTFLDSTGTPGRVTLRIEDTKLDPAAAVNSLRSLAGAGVKLVIGPQSSAEAAAILPLLDSNGMIAISQGSTAGSLSLPGDSLYRFVPDDSVEAVAIVAAARAGGITTIVPAWRGDAGNRGLEIAVRRLFTAAGGTVTAGVEYPVSGANFADVASQVSKAVLAGPAGKTAVFLASFDDVVDVFHAAASAAGLSAIPWYGSDGQALSVPLASDSAAAAFAMQTGFVTPTLLRSDPARPKWQPLVDAVTASTKIEPDAFSLAAYDACWCGILARLLAGGDYVPAWKSFLTQSAETFYGATGWGRLNANGDRAYGDFEFWGLKTVGDAAKWTSMATYQGGAFALRP